MGFGVTLLQLAENDPSHACEVAEVQDDGDEAEDLDEVVNVLQEFDLVVVLGVILRVDWVSACSFYVDFVHLFFDCFEDDANAEVLEDVDHAVNFYDVEKFRLLN